MAAPDTSNLHFLRVPLSSPPLPQAFISQRDKNEFHFPNAKIAGAERNQISAAEPGPLEPERSTDKRLRYGQDLGSLLILASVL